MIDAHIDNPKSIKYYVKRYLLRRKGDLAGKVVLDVPAGNGATAEILLEMGAKVEAFDLFPEYFMLEGIPCKRADIMEGIPVSADHADMVICQEGIEHFSDQAKTFKEFNRVLKTGGELLITTPSYSDLASKLNYLLFESETVKHMPPNEIDDIWMSDKSISSEIYHGHIFLLGIQKLRVLAKLAGFKIKEIQFVRWSKGSIPLFILFYPLIFISSYWRYFKKMKAENGVPLPLKKTVYSEQLRINLQPKHLLDKHIFIVFEKEMPHESVDFRMESVVKPFEKIM